MPRILIDANPVVQHFVPGLHVSGIGRSTMELIWAMDRVEEIPFEIMLFSQNLKGIGGRSMQTRFPCRHLYLRNTPFFNRLSLALRLRELLSRYDLMHITSNYDRVANPSRCIVTLHDALFMKINERQYNHLEMRLTVPPFIRQCRHIITPSEASRRDILETMGVEPEKVTVIPWGVRHDIFYREADREIVRQQLMKTFGLVRPYFLMVSCNAERKRSDVLIRAYIDLHRHAAMPPANDLVLLWRNPPEQIRSEVARSGLSGRIHFISGVDDDDLSGLYNCATASFTPSAYEGFGFPILEAMACGCPVVSARNTSLPEVGGDVALYADEPIAQSLPRIMAVIERGELDLANLGREGEKRSKLFTWERTARQTLAVYQNELEKL